jgi:uncharacterized protein YdgA (DUF945 family)
MKLGTKVICWIGVAVLLGAVALGAVSVTELKIQYEIQKSCAKYGTFQVDGTHYECKVIKGQK